MTQIDRRAKILATALLLAFIVGSFGIFEGYILATNPSSTTTIFIMFPFGFLNLFLFFFGMPTLPTSVMVCGTIGFVLGGIIGIVMWYKRLALAMIILLFLNSCGFFIFTLSLLNE